MFSKYDETNDVFKPESNLWVNNSFFSYVYKEKNFCRNHQ